MKLKRNVLKVSILIFIIILIQSPIISSMQTIHQTGFDKGPSYTSVIPTKKTTFVNFDTDSYLDDYAYLSAIPTTVFYDKQKDSLISHPLLLYNDKLKFEEEEHKTLNDYQGLEYFMEDWMKYCNNKLDQMTLINVPERKAKKWNAKEYISINGDNPYEIAQDIALQDWSYSNDAVIAVIDENFEKPDKFVSGKVGGAIPANDVKEEFFEVPQVNKLNPQYKQFRIPEGYKYVQARTWFACLEKEIAPFMWMVIPAGDKDMQLYCKYNDEWMQTAACSTNTNQWGSDPKAERAKSYVYRNGDWMVGITDIPTEGNTKPDHVINDGLLFTRHGTWREVLSNLIKDVVYNVEVYMYPGTEVNIPDNPPFECDDVTLKLTWDDPNVNLGFSLIGPGGEEILSVLNESRTDTQEMHLDELGRCLKDEKYKICVFTMDSVTTPIDFNIEYSWGQRIKEEEGEALTSASEGAVLASSLNAPLLYTSSSKLPESTKDTLYKLGVENVYLLDIGERLSKDALREINDIVKKNKHYKELDDIINDIMKITNQNDVIWTTIDPWSYWFFDDEPAGEKEKALFIGPAAYCAAHHGSPVLIVDMHPKLSSSVVWHNEFWKRNADRRVNYHPSVSEMYLTGMRAYDCLNDYNYDKDGMESMITVSDHFDIGMSWDRVFVGKATPGRIMGTPVDTTVWINRNVFYPALIFMNPSLNKQGVQLINGSVSHRRAILPWGKRGLIIDRPSQEETFRYPILHTYTGYLHRFNEMASKYYGFKYTTADEKIPGETITFDPIDDGVNLKYTGEPGSFFPDITTTEIGPFYASKGDYSNVFSTAFEPVANNLNEGVIMWIRSGHGTNGNGGGTTFWDPDSNFAKEENPWRGYEWYLGSTEDPDTMTMDVHGIIPALLGNPNMNGILRTGVDWAPAKKPIIDKIGNLLGNIPIVKNIGFLQWVIDTEDYKDGMVQSVMLSTLGYKKVHGLEVDESLDNIHSCGVLMGDCQPAGTYYHLALVRHGSAFQIIDPWPTSWYGSTWEQSVPRDLVMGNTIGEAYVKGISKVGILYITDPPQWWWDLMENVCYYGDPDLRPFVPGTDYSIENNWNREDTEPIRYNEEINFEGHMPFGATSYPNEKQPTTLLEQYFLPIILATIIILAIIGLAMKKKKNRK